MFTGFFDRSLGSVRDALFFLALVFYFQSSDAIKLQALGMGQRQTLVRKLNEAKALLEGKTNEKDTTVLSYEDGWRLRKDMVDLGVLDFGDRGVWRDDEF